MTPPAALPTSETDFYSVSRKLVSLVGRSHRDVAHSLLTTLVPTTGADSGRLFLTDEQGKPEYCLELGAEHLTEYDEITSPPLQEQGLAGWAFRQRRTILVSNIATDPRRGSWAAAPEESAVGSALAIPILVAAQSIGAIALGAEHPNHFIESDAAHIGQIVDHAAVVIYNARLYQQVSQQQNTITALRQTIRTIHTSLEHDRSLNIVLRQLIRVVPYQHAMILLRKDRKLRPVAMTESVDFEGRSELIFASTDIPSIIQALSQDGPSVIEQRAHLKDLNTLAFPEPIRAGALAPLTAHGETLGIMVLASPNPVARDDQVIFTIQAFADHAAVAITHDRLTQRTERRLRELAFLNETGQAITATLNLDQILHLLLERVRELLNVDAASIALRDERTGDLVFEAAAGEGEADVIGMKLNPGQGIAGWVAETGKPLVVQDVQSDSRFFAEIDKRTGVTTQAILCIPIVLKGHVVGVIEALNPDRVSFDEQAIELLNAMAGLAATAIENARLFTQVHNAEARYEGLFEDSINPIIITDLHGTIADANRNACSLLGQTKAALRGNGLASIRSADGRLDFASPLERIQEEKEVLFQTSIRSNGQRKTVEIKGKQVLVKGTPLIQWIGRDISAEIELDQTREDLVRMLIHDLRNPLANIMNSLDVLHDVILEKDPNVSQDELLRIARRSGQRMQQLISSILDISRLETGQAILKTHPTDLVPILREATEFVQPQADIREINLTMSLAASLPQVDIDGDMILRVVINLLDNATKFTQIGGAASLTARASGPAVEIVVADNGPGIPDDQLETIFEKFTRVRRRKDTEGTGLGLAFCLLAVKAHNGHIWAESTLGLGTTVRLTLPTHTPRDLTEIFDLS